MRLIDVNTLKIHEFLSEDRIPAYAILSHTWEEEECTLQHLEASDSMMVSRRKGYEKIQLCCKQALKDGLQWAWVDTCCIDKTSTAELSEAINSMFRWYRKASVCYAYLSDVKNVPGIAQSRWFTRGWTLQELVAPADVWFYNAGWHYLGSKLELQSTLYQITGIEAEVLKSGDFDSVSIARRMSWAAKRQTSRAEDLAYSLMGIFDVNMPLLYGEGSRAFTRLQEAILRVSDDQSLFAWGLPAKVKTMQEFLDNFRPPHMAQMQGLLARSPSDFTFSRRIHVLEDLQSTLPPIVSNNGVRIELQVKRPHGSTVQFAVIYCTVLDRYKCYLGFPILPWGGRWVARCGELVAIAVADLVTPMSDKPYRKPSVLLVKAPVSIPEAPKPNNLLKIVHIANEYKDYYTLDEVRCSAHATYSAEDQTLTLSADKDALHAVLFYSRAKHDPIEMFPHPTYKNLKRRMARTIDETCPAESFIITAKGKTFKDDEYTFIYPPFAILVGGVLKDPWVESVLILSDDSPDADFRTLQAASEQFVRSCATRKGLLSLLGQAMTVEPLCGRRRRHERQLIIHWYYSLDLRGSTKEPESLSKDKRWLSVDAELRLISSNLVERSLVLFVRMMNAGDEGWMENQQPKWWASFQD